MVCNKNRAVGTQGRRRTGASGRGDEGREKTEEAENDLGK